MLCGHTHTHPISTDLHYYIYLTLKSNPSMVWWLHYTISSHLMPKRQDMIDQIHTAFLHLIQFLTSHDNSILSQSKINSFRVLKRTYIPLHAWLRSSDDIRFISALIIDYITKYFPSSTSRFTSGYEKQTYFLIFLEYLFLELQPIYLVHPSLRIIKLKRRIHLC